MNTKILASNIQTLRLKKSWTQNDLAEFMNVSRQHWIIFVVLMLIKT